MIRTIVWFIYFGISSFFTLPSLIKAKKYEKDNNITERDIVVDRTAKKWAKNLVKLTGSKITVIGEENITKSGPVLFVSNHQGNFDIPILLGYINKPKAFIAKIEMLKMPIIRTWMVLMQCVFMDRGNPRKSIQGIKEGINILKAGYSIVVFPEGTRSKDGSLGEFKAGSLRLATKSGVPIVPITIKGTNKIMEKGSLIIKPSEVEIVISPAINPEDILDKDTNELTELVKDVINKKL